MAFKYLPHTEADIASMLRVVGADSLQQLYDEVPEVLKLSGDYALPQAKSEIEVRHIFDALGKQNRTLVCFAGAGVYDHYTPSVIPSLVSRSEFLTSYTPYQAEVSQGTLQYIFEYQTMLADLTGMDYANSSMYDGTTATTEAMFMALAAGKKKSRVLIAETMHPQTVRVMATYAGFHGITIERIAQRDGRTDLDDLKTRIADDVAAVFVQSVNYFGIVEDFEGFAEVCHAHKALLVVNCRPSTLSVVKSPGEWGADIAVGDAQSLGVPLSYGGPYIGFLCATKSLVRKMPGRIVGATTDADGKRAFVLTMQAREQHIRREKATSNICTNQGLMALFVTIYLSLMGKSGLREANDLSYAGAHYLYDALVATGKFAPVFAAPFLHEFCVRTTLDVEALQRHCARHGFLCGVRPEAEGMDDCLLLAVTEMRTKAEIDQFIDLIKDFQP